MQLTKTLWYDENSTPPTQYLWVKNGKILKYNLGTRKWQDAGLNLGSGSNNSGKTVLLDYSDDSGFSTTSNLIQLRQDYEDGTIFNNIYTYFTEAEEYVGGSQEPVLVQRTHKARILSTDELDGCTILNSIGGNINTVVIPIFDCDLNTLKRVQNFENALKEAITQEYNENINYSLLYIDDEIRVLGLDDTFFGPFIYNNTDAYTFGDYDEEDEYGMTTRHIQKEYPIIIGSRDESVPFDLTITDEEDNEHTKSYEGARFVLTDANGYLYKVKLGAHIITIEDEANPGDTLESMEYYVSELNLSNEKFKDWVKPNRLVYEDEEDPEANRYNLSYMLPNPNPADEDDEFIYEDYPSVDTYKYVPVVATEDELERVRNITYMEE